MASFNKIIIMGNLGRDPELRYTPNGKAVATLSVATTDKKRDKNGDFKEVTTWYRATLWDKMAENASKYLTKGSSVYLEGRLSQDEWTDRDGKTRTTLEVAATDMQFVGTGNRSEDQADRPKSRSHSAGAAGMEHEPFPADNTQVEDPDIPF